MLFLDEVGRFKKFLILQYRLFLFRTFIIEMAKKLLDELEQLIRGKSDSKEELESNIKQVANRVTEAYQHNLIKILGISKIDRSFSCRITASHLDLNRGTDFLRPFKKEASNKSNDLELLQQYFHLEEQDARTFSESFSYLAESEKSPKNALKDLNILPHTQKLIEVWKKLGQISNDRNKSYSKEVYLRLIGFLLCEYMADRSYGAIIKTIYLKMEAALKKNPSETFKLLSLFFSQKTKFRNISEILTKDRTFDYLDRDLAQEMVMLGQKISSEIQQRISKTLNKVEKISDISEAIEQMLYSDINPYQLVFSFIKPDLLNKIFAAIQFREDSSKILPQVQIKDIDHILELYRNMYEGEYWLLLGFLICLDNIINKGSFNEKCILKENFVKTRESVLVKLDPANQSLILFNSSVTPRHIDAHNKVWYSEDLKEIHIRGETTILKVDELEQNTREKAKILFSCHSFIEFFEIFISNFIILEGETDGSN